MHRVLHVTYKTVIRLYTVRTVRHAIHSNICVGIAGVGIAGIGVAGVGIAGEGEGEGDFSTIYRFLRHHLIP